MITLAEVSAPIFAGVGLDALAQKDTRPMPTDVLTAALSPSSLHFPDPKAFKFFVSYEYGAGIDRYELGLPKGRLDRDETVEQGANRELKEEVGYGARELHILTTLSLSPAYMTSMTHVVLARELYPEKLAGDEPEELEVVPWKMSQLHELIACHDVSEGRSIAALFIAREYLAGRFKPQP
jgi:8-oxo-dGTP pyrophosphatase MutT (NUDIX family)